MTPAIARLAHVALTTPDLERSLWFFRDVLGLHETERADGAIYLRGWGEFDHHSLVLREGPTGVDHFGWRTMAPADVEGFAAALEEQGVEVQRSGAEDERGHGAAIRFVTPHGYHPFELFFEVDRPARPGVPPTLLPNQSARAYGPAVAVRRLDHINIHCGEVEEGERFLADTLGFQRREFIQPTGGPVLASWMSVTSQAHDLAIGFDFQQRPSRLDHIAFQVEHVSDLLRAAEIFREEGLQIDLMPGKHGIASSWFLYVRDPGSGHRVEVYAGGYHVHDPDWEPVRWDETNLVAGLVWIGPDFRPGSGGPRDGTTPCLPELDEEREAVTLEDASSRAPA